MLQHLLIACGAIVTLTVAWLGVQTLVRKQSPEIADGADVLACRMCGVDGSCGCGLRRATSRGLEDEDV